MSRRRLGVAGAVVAAPSVFGLLFWWVSQPYPDSLEGPILYAPMEVGLFAVATIAIACAAVASTLASTLIFHSRLQNLQGPEFGRILALAGIPLTGVVFAALMFSLLLRIFDGQLTGVNWIDITQVDATRSAFIAFAVSVWAFPVAAWVSNYVRVLSREDLLKSLSVMVAGEIPAVFGLVLGLLALGALYQPVSVP